MFRKIKILSLTAFVLLVSYGFYYCWISFPIATGYGAKVLCSSIFVSGRNEKDVRLQDLDFTPLNLASFKVNYSDSSVSCSMFGFARKKAIYRTGLGATIVNEFSEKEIRMQHFRLPVRSRATTENVPWPMGDKTTTPFPAGIDSLQVMAAVNKVIHQEEKAYTNFTRALIVLFDGRIVAESYAPGFTAQTRFTGWSMTKSIMSAITGILVSQHRLDLDGPAPVAEWSKNNDPRHAITVKHLLQQTSGLDFEEVYDTPSDANRMLFVKGNAAAYAASHHLKYPSGADFRYSSGNSNILSRICRQVIGESDYHSFPYEQLFFKLGMYSMILEPDASGTFVGSSFSFATARDWARFGLLFFNKGLFNNEQVLSEAWVQQSTKPSGAAEQGQYGFQWWLNAGAKDNRQDRLYPELPLDMYFADGFEGQNIFIIPSKKLVVVRLGLTRNRYWGEHEFLKSLIKAIKN